MQLKHVGKGLVQITLTKPEAKRLENARDLLRDVAVLPCDQKELAATTADAVRQLLASMTRTEKNEVESENLYARAVEMQQNEEAQ